MTSWQVGTASALFPIAVGTPLAGYMARTGSSLGTLDDLSVGALVLSQGQDRLALVTVDLVAVDVDLASEVTAAAGLNPGDLALCASHTHSGPAGIIPRLHPAEPVGLNPDLRARFVATCASVVSEASACQEAVDLLFGASATQDIAANRNDPTGPYDDRVSVLAARCPRGRLVAILVHFACHPTVLRATNRFVSADFPGFLRQELAEKLAAQGQQPQVSFVNGAAGDVSTRFTRLGQDAAEVARIGEQVAAAGMVALQHAAPVQGPLQRRQVGIPLRRRSEDDLDTGLLCSGVKVPASNGRPEAQDRWVETQAQGARLLAGLRAADVSAVPAALNLHAWLLGNVAILPVPGELFASLGQDICAAAPLPTLVFGYTNGYVGYLPDTPAFDAKTYEALASPYPPGTGEQVVEVADTLLRALTEEKGHPHVMVTR